MSAESTSEEKIKKQLAEANLRLDAIVASGGIDAFRSAQEIVLGLERSLADLREEPHAIPCDFPVKWDVGAPLPILFKSDDHAFLTFYVARPNPNWDGKTVKIVHPGSPEVESLCLVKFNWCVSAKLGHPNDEAQGGHTLYKRGLKGYSAQIVKNSPWIKEVEKTNSVHERDNPETWSRLNHYIFWFHDSTFECLAESYEVEVSEETMTSLLNRVIGKLTES